MTKVTRVFFTFSHQYCFSENSVLIDRCCSLRTFKMRKKKWKDLGIEILVFRLLILEKSTTHNDNK